MGKYGPEKTWYLDTFHAPLDKDKGVTVHVKNLRALAVKMFKLPNNHSTSLMSEIFDKQNNTFEIFLNLIDEMYEVSSMVQKPFLFLVLKSGILYKKSGFS